MNLRTRIKNAWEALTSSKRNAPYNAGSVDRLSGDWIASRLSSDDELRWNMVRIRDRARDLERNNSITKQFLRLLSVNVIGPNGIKLQSQVRDNSMNLNKRFNDKIERAWEDWCYTPTTDGKLDFVSLQRLLLKTVARDGEVFVRVVRGFSGNRFAFALEVIDPELIDERLNVARGSGVNEIRLGVEIDANGAPVAYHGWNVSPRLSMSSQRQRVVYPADQIIHLYDPDRINQTRGVSWMTPVMVPMRHLAAYAEAELVAARTAASKMGFFQRKSEIGISGISDGSDPTSGSFTMSADPGTFGILPDGYELSSWSPDHPSTAFSDFMKTQMRDVATGLGVTYNALANDLENVNYSSIRAGLLIERDMWRCLQRWWICAFLRPVYREWLNMSLLNGAIVLDNRDVRRFLEARWIPRGWAWVDPLKDTQAGIMAIGAGLASRTSLLAEQGLDHEQVFEELQEEDALAELMGLDIEVKPESPDASATNGGNEAEDDAASMDAGSDGADAADAADPEDTTDTQSMNGTGGGRTTVPEQVGAQAIKNRLHRHL